MGCDLSRRKFSHLKLLLLLIIVLNLEINEKRNNHLQYFERDLGFCSKCFQSQADYCRLFLQRLEYDRGTWATYFLNVLPFRGKRSTNFLQTKDDNTKILSKYFARNINFENLQSQLNVNKLQTQFFNVERINGFQFCPGEMAQRFVKYFQSFGKHPKEEVTIWLYMLINVQPMLLPYLNAEGFAVPKTYASCGFSVYQAHAGKTLLYFYGADFGLKLKIAKQLLEAVLKFSYGFYGFRIYVTDLNADNVVYDELAEKISFIDLDTVLIVDSIVPSIMQKAETHSHKSIDCEGCFAYVAQDICAHKLSDINIYSACQFLREDLYRNADKGFLKPIPVEVRKSYPQLLPLLDVCVDCSDPKYKQRFPIIYKLMELLDIIAAEYYY